MDNQHTIAVVNISISKIESKSQRNATPIVQPTSCGKYQYFKDRKQITTNCLQEFIIKLLW